MVLVLNAVVNQPWRNLQLHYHTVLETTLVLAYDVLFWGEEQQLDAQKHVRVRGGAVHQ
jgi:hypothetical protein